LIGASELMDQHRIGDRLRGCSWIWNLRIGAVSDSLR
jgi:hypothetical protein